MADGTRKAQSQTLNEKLAALLEVSTDDVANRRRQIAQWIDALVAAEAAAKTAPDAKRRLFQATYRIKEVKDPVKGTADQRREALVAILESLKPAEKHISTSTWIIRLHIEQAQAVTDLLAGPLGSGPIK